MAGNIIHVEDFAHHLTPGPWVLVRRVAERYRVMVSDPRNPNPVLLSEHFDSLWTALLSARARAKALGASVYAVGCDEP